MPGLDLAYSRIDSRPEALALLSKYVSDYARDAATVSAGFPLIFDVWAGQRISYTRRADGRDYWVLDSRLSRKAGSARLYLDVSNLLNTSYQEVRGVDMPPRWTSAGVEFSVP